MYLSVLATLFHCPNWYRRLPLASTLVPLATLSTREKNEPTTCPGNEKNGTSAPVMKKLFDGIMAGAMPLELIIILRV